MIGSPLPIAIYERKLRIVSGSPTYVLSKLGRLDAACVDFDTTGPTFRATVKGKYMVLWCSQSKHETIEVAVSAPAAFAVARNEAKWQKGTFLQPMSGTYAYPTGWINPVLTIVNQTRPIMPFGHVSHSVLVDLDENEQFALSVSGVSDREWTLVAWRMPEHKEEFRLPNTQFATSPTHSQSASNVVASSLTSQYIAFRRRIQFNAASVFHNSRIAIATATNGLTYRARVRLFRDSTDSAPAGGNVVLVLRYENSGAGIPLTTIETETLVIPNTGAANNFIEHTFDFTLVSVVSNYSFDFQWQNPDASVKRCECEFFMEQTP
jgi:hypothetical protein